MYGVYSQQAAEQFGTFIYRRPDDSEVEITAVYKQLNDPVYGWPDAVWIGEVTKYIRVGRVNTSRKRK
jgi:hypothetical protein